MNSVPKDNRVAIAFLRAGLITVGSFIVFYVLGALVAYAIPDAWAAWRVGLICGAVAGGFAFLIGLIATLIYITDNHLWR